MRENERKREREKERERKRKREREREREREKNFNLTGAAESAARLFSLLFFVFLFELASLLSNTTQVRILTGSLSASYYKSNLVCFAGNERKQK